MRRTRQAQLQAALSFYRDPRTEAIYDTLDQPLGLFYADGAFLQDVLKAIKQRTTGQSKLMSGIPIYVDPVGLQEAEKSLVSTVKRPPSANKLALGEHLRHVLNPLGLGYVVQEGFLMITSTDSLDVETWAAGRSVRRVSRHSALAADLMQFR